MESWLVRFCSWLQELSSICTTWIDSRKLQLKVQRCVHRYTHDTVEWRANDQNMMTTHRRGFLPLLPQPTVFRFLFFFPSSQMSQVGSRALNQDKTRWLHGTEFDTHQSLLFSTMAFKSVFLAAPRSLIFRISAAVVIERDGDGVYQITSERRAKNRKNEADVRLGFSDLFP